MKEIIEIKKISFESNILKTLVQYKKEGFFKDSIQSDYFLTFETKNGLYHTYYAKNGKWIDSDFDKVFQEFYKNKLSYFCFNANKYPKYPTSLTPPPSPSGKH